MSRIISTIYNSKYNRVLKMKLCISTNKVDTWRIFPVLKNISKSLRKYKNSYWSAFILYRQRKDIFEIFKTIIP